MINALSSLLPSMLSSAALGMDDASTGSTGSTSGTDSTTGTSGSSSSSDSTSVGGLTSDSFLQLLVSQLTNQDPMNPTDSTTYITEESEFSMVQSMNQVSSQMASLYGSQEMQQATDLIGKNISYTDSNGNSASGVVSAASPGTAGAAVVRVGDTQVSLSSISEVTAAAADGTTGSTTTDPTTDTTGATDGTGSTTTTDPTTTS
jgi:flagellar basal-body rod modification protein FlgD